ncbi:m-AAA protease-interacting protein 1, mitochondrial [Trichonephila clavata]|uniref:M-AAA protease-interacting protein 1, mitochondrial n=1 Tax=Trichonephila clavata TaxID=2740835 RepID=A0A8X6FEG4_TRICU|nr:m-AAA protease-interacting protein 1, mitochondrial [Trichonephila clavata]
MNKLFVNVFSSLCRSQKQQKYTLDLFRLTFKEKALNPKLTLIHKIEEIKFLAAVKLTSMLQQRNLNTSSNDNEKNRNPKQSVSLMDFNPVMRPDILLSIKNWILAKFIIQPYLDKDFTLTDFTSGAKQALGIVSSYLSQGDFQSLRGLLTDDAIAEIRRNFSKLNVKERQDLFIKISDIFIVFPYQIGIIFDDDSQKRFAEITVVYHIIKDFEEMRAHGRVNSETVKEDIKICNYRFIREYTKGVKSDWTINRLGHFKLCHFEN